MMVVSEKYSYTQITGLVFGFILFIIFQFLDFGPGHLSEQRTASIAILMATWWITEAVPLGVTSLLPIFMFPILNIANTKEIASEYFNSTIFLFLGGFFIAIAMETWNLHKRISLIIIRALGSGPKGMILGFMVASAFLSMFISNTASTLMMLPIGIAVIHKLTEKYSGDKAHNFGAPLMLGIAYASSIGGISTLVGTPPNLVFLRIFQLTFPDAPEISFGNWMVLALPISVLMLIITWLLLSQVLFKLPDKIKIDRGIIKKEYRDLGKMSFEEKSVAVVFLVTGLLWIFRSDLSFGSFAIPGWSNILHTPGFIDDGTVAVFMASLLFIIPAKSKTQRSLLVAKSFNKIPWEIIILFGGGFALAKGFQISGLSELLGEQFAVFGNVHPVFMIVIICFSLTFLTELTSNTATTQTLLPILAAIAVGMKINPLFLMIPATISASFAFMMPVATPPNAIVFGSGKIKISEMARTGLILNLVGVLVISMIFYFLGDFLFKIDLSSFPEWAVPNK
jgi:solute carrier family 13 (sodium-dependent dicarboxylate transporter), member 2/3/5